MGKGGHRCGAGRPGWRVKAEGCMRLDVRDLVRRQILGRTVSTSWHWTNFYSGEEVGSIGINGQPTFLELRYSTNGVPVAERVAILRTACGFGGSRPWLHCPRCSRRVGVLYMRGGRFVCRHCGHVAYTSQSEDALGRAWRLQSKLESRLGDNWARPKGMHHSTREKIVERIFGCEMTREDARGRAGSVHGAARFAGPVAIESGSPHLTRARERLLEAARKRDVVELG